MQKPACLIKFPTNEILHIEIERTSEVVLLGITTDDQLTFKTHGIYMSNKYKLRALQRIRNYLSTEKARLLATAFINSQFYYAPLICMFASKTLISKVQEIKTLQVVYNTYEKSYNELLILIRDINTLETSYIFWPRKFVNQSII